MPVDHVSSTAGYRHSYFQEAPMDEHTLANSSRDNVPAREGSSLARRLREFGSFHIDGSSTMTKILLRLVNGVTHLLFSFVLLAIMAEFMIRYKGRARWWVIFFIRDLSSPPVREKILYSSSFVCVLSSMPVPDFLLPGHKRLP